MNEVAAMLDVSHGSPHHVIRDVQFHKVCARWVPTCRQVTAELKERRVYPFQELLQRYETEDDSLLKRIVIGDESWAHYYQPETKRASREWSNST
jgi:hypothetical protein